MAIIALDVGGSSVKHGLVVPGAPQHLTVHTTPINSHGTLAEIIGTFAAIIAHYLRADDSLQQVAFGFPGPFDYAAGVSYIRGLDKYEALYGQAVPARLREQLDRPDLAMRFRNDAEAAVVGEGVYGVGRAQQRLIGLTLGTGIGSAFLVDGAPVTAGAGVPANGWLFPQLFAGQAADEVFSTRGLLARFAANGIPLAQLVAVDPDDPATQVILSAFGRDLGQFLAPFADAFQADAVLVSGGIAHLFDHFSGLLRAQLAPRAVLRGILGERAALLGAAALFNA